MWIEFSRTQEEVDINTIFIFPNLSEYFSVYCDASKIGLGGVLMKNDQVVAYTSRQLKVHKRNYTSHNLELADVVFILKV